MTAIKSLPKSKVGFSLKINKESLKQAQKVVIANAKNEISLKGFRKGHAPDEMVIQALGAGRLYEESINKALDRVYRDFVVENKLAVISAPEVKLQEAKKADDDLVADIEVEVFPEVKLGAYKKIKTKKEKVEVTDKEVIDVVETICAQMNLGTEVDQKAAKNNLLEVDFVAHDDKGEVLPGTKADNQMFRVGLGHYLEDLEKAFIGMKPGEAKKAVKVKFPDGYHAPDMAGKVILFDITLHKVLEIEPDKLTEIQIEQISGKKQSLTDLKSEIRNTIEGNKNKEVEKKAMDEYTKNLAGLVTAELPQSWIDKEIYTRLERMKQNPQYQQNPDQFWTVLGKSEEDFKKDLQGEGEKDLKIFLGLSEIVKLENIELSEEEAAQAHQMAHQHLDTEGHEGAAHDAEVQKAVLNMKIDKYLKSAIME